MPTTQLLRPEGDESDKVYDRETGGSSSKSDLAKAKYGSVAGALGEKEQAGSKGPASMADLAKATDKLGKGFTGATPEGQALNIVKKGMQAFWGNKSRKRKTLLGGGVGAGVLGFGMFIFLGLGSQVLVQTMSNMENHFFARIQTDISIESQKLLSSYIQHRVLKQLGGKCKTSANLAKCLPKVTDPADPAEKPVDNLFENWDKEDLAGAMSREGITFRKEGGRYFMDVTDIKGAVTAVDVTKFASTKGANLFDDSKLGKAADRRAIGGLRIAYTKLLAPAGSFLYNRFTSFMAARFGIQFCALICDPTKDQTTKVDAKTAQNAEAGIERRAVNAEQAGIGEAVGCVVDVSKCGAEKKPKPEGAADPNKPVAENEYEKSIDAAVTQAVGESSGKELKATEKEATDAATKEGEKAETTFINDTVKYLSKGTAKTAEVFMKSITKFIKVTGSGPIAAIQIAAQLIDFISKASLVLRSVAYITAAAPKVVLFSTFATAAAEQQHGGHTDLRMISSFVQSIGGGTKDNLAYSYYTDPNFNTNTAKNTHKYLLSHNMAQNGLTDGITSISDAVNSIPGFSLVVGLASLINAISDGVLGPVNAIVAHIPGVKGLTDLIGKAAMPLLQFAIFHELHLPDFSHLTPQTRLDAIVVGGNESARLASQAIGQQRGTPEQIGEANAKAFTEQKQQFQQQPLFARLFSFNTPYSLASRMAVALPTTFGGTFGSAMQTVSTDMLSNPFGKFLSSFSTVFGSSFVHAANPPAEDPAGIAQYYRPANAAVYQADPQAYWTENKCSDKKADGYKEWEASRKQDPDTGQWEYTKDNGCLLVEQASSAVCQAVGADILKTSTCPSTQTSSSATETAGIKPVPCTQTGDKPDSSSALDKFACASDNVKCFDPATNPEAKTIGITDPKAFAANNARTDLGKPDTNGAVRDLGTYTGYYNGKPHKVRICAITGFKQNNNGLSQFGVTGSEGDIAVNSRFSGAIWALFWSAKKTGLTFSSNSSFRTMKYQQSLCYCDGVNVAKPGYSNHQMGLAIDFAGLPSSPGPIPGSKIWSWLSSNAGKYGVINYKHEAWHWSANGH